MATLLTVLRSGGRYDASWAERLFAGARRHAPGFTRFVLLADRDHAIEGAETVRLAHDWPRWWAKMEAFRPGLAAGTVVLLDLDTVFAGDASALTGPGLATMEDFFLKGRVSSAILRWEGDELAFLHHAFAADAARWMQEGSCGAVPNSVHGDQVVIDHLMRREGQFPRFVQELHPGLVDFYDPGKSRYGPLVVFIGESKPDGAGEPIASLWRGPDAACGPILARGAPRDHLEALHEARGRAGGPLGRE